LPDVWKVGAWPGIKTEEYISRALKHGFVTLGWAGTRDVTGKTEKEIASMLKAWDPDYTQRKLKSNARDLWRFAHIPKGDYVILYHLYKAYIGKVTRSYYWVSDGSPKQVRIFSGPNYGPHRLGVEWLFDGRSFNVDFSNLERKVLKLGQESIGRITQLRKRLETDQRFVMPVDIGEPPGRTKSEITRYVRDTAQTKKLKEEYGDECQVCGEVIVKRDGSSYSEAHHLWPLQDRGPDHMTNMLVLCPNHHARFDYRDMGVDRDCKTVVQWSGERLKKVTSLQFRKGHFLNEKYVSKQYDILRL
jgi:predicted Mrr-cat superfamily restriction endonuclease